MANTEFTWQFGQPIHREDKDKFVDLKTGRAWIGECLDEQVDRIVGKDTTVEDLLEELPPEIQYDPVRSMRLKIWKVGNLVYQAGYYVYVDPGSRDFEQTAVEFETQPSLRLALFLLKQKIKRRVKE